MNLTNNDLYSDNKQKDNNERECQDESIDIQESNNYNPNWSLRKCCSKFIDRLSYVFPGQVLEIVKPYLEDNMQNQDWQIK